MDANKVIKSKSSHTLALIVVAVSAVFAIAISSSLLGRFRVDLTEHQLYTLADGTQALLRNLEDPVSFTFYFSRESTKAVPGFREYGARIEQLLKEMVTVADGQLGLIEVDPRPFSDAEDQADVAGLRGVKVGQSGDKAYMGLVVKAQGGDSEVIPFLHPDRDGFLEYDIVEAVHKVSRKKTPVVGVMSDLPLFGGGGFQFFQAPTPAWAVMTQLEQMFTVEKIPTSADSIPENVDALIIVHPNKMSQDTAYAVEQYLFKGGKAMIFMDPLVEGAGPAPGHSESTEDSAIYDLLDAWGVTFTRNQFVGDFEHALAVTVNPNARPLRHPALLGIPTMGIDGSDSITAELEGLNFAYAGAFGLAEDLLEDSVKALEDEEGDESADQVVVPRSQVTMTPLVQTSERSDLLDVDETGDDPLADPRALMLSMKPMGKRMALVSRLQGTAVSAFGMDPGSDPINESVTPEEQKTDNDVAEGESEIGSSLNSALSASHLHSGELNVLLFGDADMLTDRLWVNVQQFMGTQVFQAFADNGALFTNSVDTLVGSDELINVRSRGEFGRPFDVVEGLKRDAEEQFRSEEEKLLQELENTEQSLAELRAEQSGDEGLTIRLTPEQKQALENFQAKKVTIRKSLRDVRLKLNEDIEQLDFNLKMINIVGVPILVTLLFIFFNLRQRARLRRSSMGAH